MTQAETKLKRMDYLNSVLWKYINTEPKLSVQDLVDVITEQVYSDDLPKLLKKYLKELKYGKE